MNKDLLNKVLEDGSESSKQWCIPETAQSSEDVPKNAFKQLSSDSSDNNGKQYVYCCTIILLCIFTAQLFVCMYMYMHVPEMHHPRVLCIHVIHTQLLAWLAT